MNISYIKIYLSNPKSIIINIQGNKSPKSNILTPHLGQPDTCRSDLQCARSSAALAKSSAQAAQLKSPRFSTACQTWGVYWEYGYEIFYICIRSIGSLDRSIRYIRHIDIYVICIYTHTYIYMYVYIYSTCDIVVVYIYWYASGLSLVVGTRLRPP